LNPRTREGLLFSRSTQPRSEGSTQARLRKSGHYGDLHERPRTEANETPNETLKASYGTSIHRRLPPSRKGRWQDVSWSAQPAPVADVRSVEVGYGLEIGRRPSSPNDWAARKRPCVEPPAGRPGLGLCPRGCSSSVRRSGTFPASSSDADCRGKPVTRAVANSSVASSAAAHLGVA
jgi:hypothetical protein